jgi:hypothetical protein
MFLAALALLSAPADAAPKYKSPDARKDWQGAGFGYSVMEEMKCEDGAFEGAEVCTRPADSGDTQIGQVKATKVTYSYFENRMYRVDIYLATDADAADISFALGQIYGPSSWDASQLGESWAGTSGRINLSRNLLGPGAVLAFEYLPILEDANKGRASGSARVQSILGVL